MISFNPINTRRFIAAWLIVVGFAFTAQKISAVTTNTFNFSNTTLTAPSGPSNPANGSIAINGSSLTVGDLVVFDGIVADVPGSTSDAWGAVELNSGGGYLGVVNATLGALVETGTASGNPCQLFINGSGTSSTFGVSQGSRTNRVRVELTCTQTGSTTNMSYVVKVDQGVTGTFSSTLTGANVTFANNTIALTFAANNVAHQFIQTQPVIAVSNPANFTAAVGVAATFAVTITQGYPINTVQQWLSNGVPILNATNLTYTTPPTSATYNGAQYNIIITNRLNPGNVAISAPATLTIRSTPGYVPFIFNPTNTPNSGQINPLSPPSVINGYSLLAGDTVFFDGYVTTNGPLTGSGNGWASLNFAAGGYQGVTTAQLGVLVRLGTGVSQLYVNGIGPASPNLTSSGALINRVRIEFYPSATGSTTNMGWSVKIDQNLQGIFQPAVTGTNLTFTNNTIPLGFGSDSVPSLITLFPFGLQTIRQQLTATNLVVGAFDYIVVRGDYLNASNVLLSPGTPSLIYTSSNTNAITVSTNGFLQAVGVGQAMIISTYSGFSASNNLTVIDPGPLQSITLGINHSMPLYSNQQASVTGNFVNATNVNLFNYGQTTFTLNNTNIVRISSGGLITAIAPGNVVINAVNSGLSSAPGQLAVTYATNRFIFDSFGDGFWTIINQGNTNTLVISSNGASQATSTNTAFDQQFEILYNYQNGTFRFRNRSTWQCLAAKPGNLVGTGLVPVNYTGTASQQWYLVDAGNGCFRIVNSQYGLVLQTDNGNPANITLVNASSSPFQCWSFAYQTHFPKKGCAGYESSYAQLGLNWAYNYDDNTGTTLPPAVNYVPMIYAAQYWEPLSDAQARVGNWQANAQPAYLLAYNEPDNSGANGGSNTATNDVLANWPQIQALNLPIVSPACATTFGTWMNNFYSQIAANNFRVDYTAVHEYVPPSAASLISTLQSAYNTWGRPIWLTEFSPVDWSNTQSWSENDNYNFLAEFMWQAEGLDWFKRYAIFPFSGTNNVSPWIKNGYRGNFFMADGVTLSPYGELYATWDADLTLESRTPYIIHNLATSFRLTATNAASTPQSSSIYTRNATTEWGLLPAAATNHWYIISLNDGRRLRDTSGNLNLASFGATGVAVEWEFSGPDSSGYYFITNTAGHCANSSGTAPAIVFNTTTSTTQNNNTRWRLIKPYQPVTINPPVQPLNLTFTYTNQSIALRWPIDSNFNYHVYRSPILSGPYSLTASISTTNYTDSNIQSGATYYYVITGLNILGEESVYSSPVSASATASSPVNILTSAANGVLQLTWPTDHLGWFLQVQTNVPSFGLGTNWTTISASNVTNQWFAPINQNSGSSFYRLLYP